MEMKCIYKHRLSAQWKLMTPIVLDKVQVECGSSILYMQGFICSSSPRCKHTFGENLLWEHCVSQMKTISTERKQAFGSDSQKFHAIKASEELQCTNWGYPRGEGGFPAASGRGLGWDGWAGSQRWKGNTSPPLPRDWTSAATAKLIAS